MKKAQFFLIALMLLALSMFVLFSFFRTTDTASVTLFKKSSFIELKNIQNAIVKKNNWLNDSDWWNASWAYRISMTGVAAATPRALTITFPKGHITYCNETRIINDSDTSDYVVYNATGTVPVCTFYFNTNAVDTFNLYYGNPEERKPTLNTYTLGVDLAFTLGDEETANLCEHFETIYPLQGIDLECGVGSSFASNQKINYSINFTSLDMEFRGYIG